MRRLAKPLNWLYRFRGFESPPLRQFGIFLFLLMSTFLPSCVHRMLRVETYPPGATIFLDGKAIGNSPMEVPFYHFGTREIVADKDGYLRTVRLFEIDGAWYEEFPFDYFTEFLPLFPRTDLRVATIALRPSPVPRSTARPVCTGSRLAPASRAERLIKSRRFTSSD